MKTLHIWIIFLLFIQVAAVQAQTVGIGTKTPNQNAILDLVSPENNQGLLVPRLTTDQRTATTFTSNLSITDNGLLVYDAELNKFFYWTENQWIELAISDLSVLPDQVGQANKFLKSDGTTAQWSNLDFNSLANVPVGLSDGDNVDDADPDPANELITEVALDGTSLNITESGTIHTLNLIGLQDGTGTDDQSASEVSVTPTGNLTATDVQGALEELQSEIVNAASAAIPDNAVSTAMISDGAVTDDKISGMSYSKLTDIPADLADGDDNTQLTETEVDDFVSNNGYLTAEVDGSTTNEIQDINFDGVNLSITSGSSIDLSTLQDGTGTDDQVASEVSVTPTGNLTSTDVQGALEELQGEIVNAASAAIPDNAVTTAKISNGAVTDNKINGMAFSKLTGVPAGLADGDDNTQLTESEVDDFVSNNGYLTAFPDNAVTTAKINNGAVTDDKINGMAFSKLTGVPAGIADGDDNTQLTETEVDNFVSNNGYLTAVPDNAVTTAKINNGAVTDAKINGMAFSKLTGVPAGLADGDDNTQLTETEVDNFVSNNGYLTVIPDNAVTTAKISSGAVTNVKINSMAFSKLTGVPAGLADGDDVDDADASATNELITSFQVIGGNIALTEAGTTRNIPLSSIQDGYEPNTDAQTLGYNTTSNILTISGGNTVDLSELDDINTDNQTLSYNTTTNILTIAGGNTVNLSELDDIDTDDQTAAEVAVTPNANLTSTNVQTALEELQSEVITASTNAVNSARITNGTIANVDISASAAIAGTKVSPNFGSQTVTGGSYSYASAQTRITTISPIEFVALTGVVEPNTVAYGLTGGLAVAVSSNASSVLAMCAPINVPNGAIITEIEVYASNSSTTQKVNVNLIRNSMGSATTPVNLFSIPSGSTGLALHTSGAMTETINKSNFSYQLLLETAGNSSLGPAVGGVRITYTVTTPD